MTSDWLGEIVKIIEPYDSVDLITSVAALQLLPQNAERALRLESLANAIVTLPREQNKPKISITKLRHICNNSPLADISSQEDPSEQAFTESFTFIGGSYIVFPGIVSDATFILRHLAKTITQYEELLPSQAFSDLAVHTLGAGLTASNLVATRAGMQRGIPPAAKGSNVYVPQSREFNRLKQAVQFKIQELNQATQERSFDLSVLAPLMLTLGETIPSEFSPPNGPLSARPLVQVDNSIILAVPSFVLAALRHKLLCLAYDYGVLDTLSLRYRNAVWQTVTRSLDYLDHKPTNMTLPRVSEGIPMVDGVFSLDTDKVLYVSLVTDDFHEYDQSRVFGEWKRSRLSQLLEERQREIEEFIFRATTGLNQIAVLHLIMGIGRSYVLGFEDSPGPLKSPRVAMTASDLEIIALLEGSNPLMLWKYAKASTQVRNSAHIVAFSALDEFYHYREHQYSYYLSDQARPTMIYFQSGSGLELVLQAVREFDFHAVPAFQPGYLVEVAKIEQKYDMPIYTPIELIREKGQLAFLVEGLPIYIWIIGPAYDEKPEQRQIHQVYLQVIDMIAYWLWQLTPSLIPLLQPLQKKSSVLVLRLDATLSNDWLARNNTKTESEGKSILEYEVLEHEKTILLHINPNLQNFLEAPDNRGERLFIERVLNALVELVSDSGIVVRQFTPQHIKSVLDVHAPLGRKKKALVLDPRANPELNTSSLPRHRSVQMANKTALLDKIGKHLTDGLRIPVGPIPDNERTEVLRSVVTFLYQKIQHLVATLNPNLLLDWLIRYYEAIRYNLAYLRLTIPTRLACFEADEEFIAQVGLELQELYEAGQVARFVIEYVSAQPPNGLRPMSLSVYDELQALASEVIHWASMSDLIHFGITDIKLSILPSGRLGSTYEAVEQAHKEFLSLHSSERIDMAEGFFDKHWHSTQASPKRPPAEVEEIDDAFRAEYGYTMTELTTLMDKCFALGTEQGSPVKRMLADKMTRRLSQNTALPLSKVAHMVEDLSLKSRTDFLKPSVPFRREDVYPWRFGRPLSYIRRPLIKITATEKGQATFVWGNLHLYNSRNYIIDMCLSGRLQSRATSQEMKSLLARFNRESGDIFTLQVKNAFATYEDLIVNSNLKKIGSMRIAEHGNDLGDIDILVINLRRRRLLIVECKDLSIARNPHEMANELQTLFAGSDKRSSTVARHQRRANWIRDHLALVLGSYGINSKGRWRVEPILVISKEMLTPHLYRPSIPVISFLTLERKFLQEWL